MAERWLGGVRLAHPVVQAGMGGGLATSALVIAVSRAGGLGTLGLLPPAPFRAELLAIRAQLGGLPFAANLLMPFTRRAHVEACLAARPAVVTLFYGFDAPLVRRLRGAGIAVWHQVGDEAQARRALADGADALIAQGGEAGGHLAGDRTRADLVRALRAVAGERPLLAAGGIHDAASAAAARAEGADAVVAGTRFLLTPESNAHGEYKARLLAAGATLRTSLFGLGWPAPHRVVPNAATARWCDARGAGPAWARACNALAAPASRWLPMESTLGLAARQRLGVPLYSPVALTAQMDARLTDVTPLYAGECVRGIRALRPAPDVVNELAQGFA